MKETKKDYDKLRTCKFYTIEEYKKLEEKDFPKMYTAEGIMITSTGYAGLDGYYDKNNELTNELGWFDEPYESIGVSVNNLISVYPKDIQKLILDINKLNTGYRVDKEKQYLKIAALALYIHENYEELVSNHISLPEICFSGTSSSWNYIKDSASACIRFIDEGFYKNSEQMGNWHNCNTSSFEKAWNAAYVEFHNRDPEHIWVRMSDRNQLFNNSVNQRAFKKFIKNYKESNNFEKEKAYTFGLKIVREYEDNGYHKEITLEESPEMWAKTKEEALNMVLEYIKEENKDEEGYRPGWVGHKTYSLKRKTPHIANS